MDHLTKDGTTVTNVFLTSLNFYNDRNRMDEAEYARELEEMHRRITRVEKEAKREAAKAQAMRRTLKRSAKGTELHELQLRFKTAVRELNKQGQEIANLNARIEHLEALAEASA